MLRAGVETVRGLTMRVYEVRADGSRSDLGPQSHTYGSRPVPASVFHPREHAEAEAGREFGR